MERKPATEMEYAMENSMEPCLASVNTIQAKAKGPSRSRLDLDRLEHFRSGR
jgi:hypothetical protein